MLIQNTSQRYLNSRISNQPSLKKLYAASSGKAAFSSLMSYPPEYYISFGQRGGYLKKSAEERASAKIRKFYENLPQGQIIMKKDAAEAAGVSPRTLRFEKAKDSALAELINAHSQVQRYAAVRGISPELSEEVIDRYLYGETPDTIASQTGININAVKRLLIQNRNFLEYKNSSPCSGRFCSEYKEDFPDPADSIIKHDMSDEEIIERGIALGCTLEKTK